MNDPSILKEPLLHFLVLGALVFTAYGWLNDRGPQADEIVVTRGQQTNLIDTFERTWRRAPTSGELDGLIDDYIRQEIAYRAGAKMELDRNDIVIRRRLRQKLELLTEDLATLSAPSEAELEAYYTAKRENFRADSRLSFEQIYLSLDRRGSTAHADALALLAELETAADIDPSTLGDAISLPTRVRDASEHEVASIFGSSFAEHLDTLTLGAWAGPVASGFGLHLVRVSARAPGRVPPLSDIENAVRNELLAQRRREAVDALYETLLESYTVRIEPFADAETAPLSGRD